MGGVAEIQDLLGDLDLAVASGDLPEQSLRERVVGLRQVIDRLEATFAEAVSVLDSRAVPAADGAGDLAAWLVTHARMSRSAARAAARLGAGMAAAPVLASALESGQVSPESARILLRARNPRTSPSWERDLSLLVDLARNHGPDKLELLIRHWKAAADPDGVEPATDRNRNELTLSMLGGRGLLRGDFDAESAAILAQAIADVVDELWRAAPESDRGRRSTAWWRAEALCELIRRARGVSDPDAARPARPLITVVVEVADLLGPRGRLVELPTGELIGAEAVRRLACDAEVARVVMKGKSEPVDAGRAHRQPSSAQYRAVLARDRGCGLPNCKAPPWMCEIHHIRHWADGGSTDIDNLVMTCRAHHRLVHEGGFTVIRQPGGGFGLERPNRSGQCRAA